MVIHDERSFWGRTVIIILDGGYSFAMVSMMDNDESVANIHDIIVHADRRGRGWGSRLLELATESARHLGASIARLAVDPDSWMCGWYERHGFREKGITSYDSHDCLVMEKEIRREAVEPQATESAISIVD